MKLIHNPRSFQKDTIVRNASKYGFANPWAVELFLWDLEIAAQLQSTSGELILKGGSAAQLFLPVEAQRGSRDIDMLALMSRSKVEQVLKETERTFDGPKFIPFVPRNPNENLPLVTYTLPIKSNFHAGESTIKVDFLLEGPDLPSVDVRDRETFAVKTVKLRCLRPEVLVGEKTLTLARESIGIQDYGDLPKHVYDVSMLVESTDFRGLAGVATAIKVITPIEATIHGMEVDPVDAVHHVIRFIDAELGPVDTTFANDGVKRSFESFESFYAPTSQQGTLEEWSARALKIGFLAKLVQGLLRGKFKSTVGDSIFKRARSLATALQRVKGVEAVDARKALLATMKRTPYYKELRGKALHRVFWQVATPENLEDLPDFT